MTESYLYLVNGANGVRECERTTPLATTKINGTRQRQLCTWSVECKPMLKVEPGIAVL